jgi:uncharacterized protein YyaL (SSP411 family)
MREEVREEVREAVGTGDGAASGDVGKLLRVAMMEAPWGTAIASGLPGSNVPLLAGRGLVDGRPAAYVCQKFTCRLPVVLPEDLRGELRAAR